MRPDADLTIALARRADPRNYGVVVDRRGRPGPVAWWRSPAGARWPTTPSTPASTSSARGAGVDPGRRAERLGPGHHPRAPRPRRPGLRPGGHGRVLGGRRHASPATAEAQRDVLDGLVHSDGRRLRGGSRACWWPRAPSCRRTPIVRPPVYIGPFAKIEADAIVGPYTVVGTNALIRSRAVVDHCVLHPNVFVGNDADLRGSIVGRATEIRQRRPSPRGLRSSPTDCTIMDGAVIGTDVHDLPGQDDRRGHRRRRVGRVGVARPSARSSATAECAAS